MGKGHFRAVPLSDTKMATFKEFIIPSCLEELADDASAIAHRVVNLTELGEMSVHAVDDYANGEKITMF